MVPRRRTRESKGLEPPHQGARPRRWTDAGAADRMTARFVRCRRRPRAVPRSPLPSRSLPTRAVALALCLASCATYTQRTEVAMAHFEAGELELARAEFEDPATTGSDFLGAAESGTVALVQGDWSAARERP